VSENLSITKASAAALVAFETVTLQGFQKVRPSYFKTPTYHVRSLKSANRAPPCELKAIDNHASAIPSEAHVEGSVVPPFLLTSLWTSWPMS